MRAHCMATARSPRALKVASRAAATRAASANRPVSPRGVVSHSVRIDRAALISWMAIASASAADSASCIECPSATVCILTTSPNLLISISPSRWCGADDDVGLQVDDLDSQSGQAIEFSIRKAALKRDGLVFAITEVTQALPKGLEARRERGGGAGPETADASNLRRRLRSGSKRSGEKQDGHEGQEPAGRSSHNITPVTHARGLPNAGRERRRRANASQPAAPLPCSTPHRRRRSFDYLIGSQQERRRDRQADGLGRPVVDHQLELCGLLDREVSRISPLQDLIHVGGGAPVQVWVIRPKGHEATRLDELPGSRNGRQPALAC